MIEYPNKTDLSCSQEQRETYAEYAKLTRNAIMPGQTAMEPVVVFDDPDIPTSDWFNYVWQLVHDGEHPLAFGDWDRFVAERKKMGEYLTALMYLRWSVSDCIDIEPDLMGKIKETLQASSFEDASAHPPSSFDFDYAAEEGFFEGGSKDLADDMASWLSDAMVDIAYRDAYADGSGADFISAVRDADGKIHASFTLGGWDYALGRVTSNCMVWFGNLAYLGMSMCVIKDITEKSESAWDFDDDEMPAMDIDLSRADSVFGDDVEGGMGIDPVRTGIIIANAEDNTQWEQWILTLLAMDTGVMPEGIDNVIMFMRSANPRSHEFCRDFAQRHGLVILADHSLCEENALEGAFDEMIEYDPRAAKSIIGMYTFKGTVPTDVIEQIHKQIAANEAEAFMTLFEMSYELVQDDRREFDESFDRDTLNAFIEEMSFGSISLDGIGEEMFHDSIHALIYRELSSDKAVSLGKLARDIRTMSDMYSRHGLLGPQSVKFTSEHEDDAEYSRGWKGVEGERWTRAEAIEHAQGRAKAAGIDQYFEAHKKGFALDDLTCGLNGFVARSEADELLEALEASASGYSAS